MCCQRARHPGGPLSGRKAQTALTLVFPLAKPCGETVTTRLRYHLSRLLVFANYPVEPTVSVLRLPRSQN